MLDRFKKMLGGKEKSAFERVQHGRTYLRSQRYDLAEKELRQALVQDESIALGHRLLAEVLVRTDRRPEALEHFRRAAQLDPQMPEVNYEIGVHLSKERKFEEAARYFRQEIQVNPRYAAAHLNLALCLVALKRYAEAVAPADKAVEYGEPLPPELKKLLDSYRRR
jgi:Tfp pilus assembly protein PilF